MPVFELFDFIFLAFRISEGLIFLLSTPTRKRGEPGAYLEINCLEAVAVYGATIWQETWKMDSSQLILDLCLRRRFAPC